MRGRRAPCDLARKLARADKANGHLWESMDVKFPSLREKGYNELAGARQQIEGGEQDRWNLGGGTGGKMREGSGRKSWKQQSVQARV
ncbi:hypothetical protein BaRGS_00022501 [Batillaria attramentaria]|uniref:Uncharacterized protein n=1 Tax=Batillaria attramentaria TaxID=370345 RepID=A0ABD0KG82_9CAEN